MGGGGEGAVASGAAVVKKMGAGFFSGMESVKVAPPLWYGLGRAT